MGDDDDDALEAYDLWDDQDDLAKVAEPVYLDQLIESESCGVTYSVGVFWFKNAAIVCLASVCRCRRCPRCCCAVLF